MQMMKVGELAPHPRNTEFFDDMTGGKWNDFIKSIKTSGVIEPIIVTQDKVVVSGHQRLRACKSLGIKEVAVEMRNYDSEDAVIKDLIETNIRQRGDVGGSDIKLGNRIKELERIYGVRNGSAGKVGGSIGTSKMTDSKLAEQMGIDLNTLKRAKALASLPLEILELVDKGTISPSAASRLIAKLTPEEQEKLAVSLPAVDRLTQKQVQTYIDQIQAKDNQIAGYELKAEQDKQEKERLRSELKEAKNAEQKVQVVTKEVVPADYEEVKKERERLRSENKLLQAERDVLSRDYKARCDEVTEMKDKMSAVREDATRENIKDELQQDCIFFCARCDSFLKAVGGYAYLADRLDVLPKLERESYKKAVESIMAWAQNILSAM